MNKQAASVRKNVFAVNPAVNSARVIVSSHHPSSERSYHLQSACRLRTIPNPVLQNKENEFLMNIPVQHVALNIHSLPHGVDLHFTIQSQYRFESSSMHCVDCGCSGKNGSSAPA
jgi:hypothetical protein